MVYVFLAEGFEEVEALAPVDLLRRAGVKVVMAGVGAKTITGSHGIPVEADLVAQNLDTQGLEAIVLPGGLPGTLNLEASQEVSAMVDHCAQSDILIAAICAAPSILGHKGLLRGKEATSAPGFQKELEGAAISDDYVCLCGNILTARGMGVATQFGLKLVELLVSKEKAQELEDAIQWKK